MRGENSYLSSYSTLKITYFFGSFQLLVYTVSLKYLQKAELQMYLEHDKYRYVCTFTLTYVHTFA